MCGLMRNATIHNSAIARMKMQKEVFGMKVGDYCHAHRWADAKPEDPWAVGFLKSIIITKSGILYVLEGEGVPQRPFQHCSKITAVEGEKLLRRKSKVAKF